MPHRGNKPYGYRIKSLAFSGLIALFYQASCLPKKQGDAATEHQAALDGPELVAHLIDTNRVIYGMPQAPKATTDDHAPSDRGEVGVQGQEDAALRLGYVAIRDAAPDLPITYRSAPDALKAIPELQVLRDANGQAVRRFELEGGRVHTDIRELQELIIRERPGNFAVPRTSELNGEMNVSIDIYDYGKFDTDTGIADLVTNLRTEMSNPKNPIRAAILANRDQLETTVPLRTKTLNSEGQVIEVGGQANILRRLQLEFDGRYKFTLNDGILKITPGYDALSFAYELTARGEGPAAKPTLALDPVELQLALASDRFLPPGEDLVIGMPQGGPDFTKTLAASPLYRQVRKLDPDSFPPGYADKLALEKQPMDFYLLRRNEAKEVPINLGELADMQANNPTFRTAISDLAGQFFYGRRYGLKPEYLADSIPSKVLGKGAGGEVKEVKIGDVVMAEKTSLKPIRSGSAYEAALQIYLGKYGIGAEVYAVDTFWGTMTLRMAKADGTAHEALMSKNHMLTYGDKMVLTGKLGLLFRDDKVANILLTKNEAFMHDFDFVQWTKDSRVPEGFLPHYGAYGSNAPIQALAALTAKTEAAAEGRAPARVPMPGYKWDHDRSFYFAFNLLSNRLNTFSKVQAPNGKQGSAFYVENAIKESQAKPDPGHFVSVQADRRRIIDGDKFAQQFAGQHDKAGLTKESFDYLLSMISNDYQSRPSVESFLARFRNEDFAKDAPAP